MDSLNRLAAPLSDFYRSMTPGARVLVALLLVVVVASLGYLSAHQTVSADSELMPGVPLVASQLPQMEAAFAKANLKGYVLRGTSIFVPRGQEGTYIAALADAKVLPPNLGAAEEQAIKEWGPFIGHHEREERLKIAKQRELAQCLCRMNGIETAYVMYDIDTKRDFSREKVITATATIKPVGASYLDESRVIAIRHLIAGAIANLRPENVTVSDLNAGRTWHGSTDEHNADQKTWLALERSYEQELRAKILNALRFIPNVTVEPSVTFARPRVAHRRPQQIPDTSREERTTEDKKASPASVHAVINSLLGSPTNDATKTKRAPVANPSAPGERENLLPMPILARVSVGVPLSYFRSIWQQQQSENKSLGNSKTDLVAIERIRAEESAKIQHHVAQLLPSAEGVADLAQLVTVTTFQDIVAAPVPAPAFRDRALAWLVRHWQTVGLLAVALLGLLLVAALVRPRSAKVVVTPVEKEIVRVDAAATAAVRVPPSAPHFTPVERVLREELSEMVENDPDAAAHILRTWIGQVS